MDNLLISRGRGHGYVKVDGTICMDRCFDCGKLNYAIAVNSGSCFWCGYSPGKHVDADTKLVTVSSARRPCRQCTGYGSDGQPCRICKSINPGYIGLSFPNTPEGIILKVFVYLEKDETK